MCITFEKQVIVLLEQKTPVQLPVELKVQGYIIRKILILFQLISLQIPNNNRQQCLS